MVSKVIPSCVSRFRVINERPIDPYASNGFVVLLLSPSCVEIGTAG